MQKIWKVREPNKTLQDRLTRSLDISPIIAQILINRGISAPREAEEFLNCDPSSLYDPFLLKDMEKAVVRIKGAIQAKQKIMVYGDYDVDGVTAVALLVRVLSELGADVTYHIPNRLEEGYGLSRQGTNFAQRQNVSLLISADCGISGFGEIDYLNQMGIDTIITDHHEPIRGNIPRALAVIDPLRNGCPYPYKYLSGVGVAFKLAQALSGDDLDHHLDLVCLGTVADVVPLTGENRLLVKHGLEKLRQTKKVGLRALIDISGLSGKKISSYHVGYILGPRINATGRLGSPEGALRLLLTTSGPEANNLARILDDENRERQRLESRTLKETLIKIEREINFKDHWVIVLSDTNWHPGVIGIVASRLVEKFYRPTILIWAGEDLARGSGRSIKNFHLFQALSQFEELLEGYGGHQYACGLTILKENLARFKDSINKFARATLSSEDLIPQIDIDIELALDLLTEELIGQIEDLQPFGPANPRPLFSSRNLELKTDSTVAGRDTLKFWVTDQKITCEAIGFKMAPDFRLEAGDKVDLAYSPTIDNWQGETSIQLQIKDIIYRENNSRKEVKGQTSTYVN